jgi:activator of 2-hydroxyglutaryl-CoA dehydratase
VAEHSQLLAELGLDVPLLVPDEPQIVGALGAALSAAATSTSR